MLRGGALNYVLLVITLVDSLPTPFENTYDGPSNGGITTKYNITGFTPDFDGVHPVFMSFGGTGDGFPTRIWSTFSYQMALRGFVSAHVQYDNTMKSVLEEKYMCPVIEPKADAIYTGDFSALTKLCEMSQVNCSAGIATAGYTQGGYIAFYGAQKDSRVTATLGMAVGSVKCMSKDSLLSESLPQAKRRVLNAFSDCLENMADTCIEDSVQMTNIDMASGISGYDCGMNTDCLQADGSGYYLLSHTDFTMASCGEGSIPNSFFVYDGHDDRAIHDDSQFACDFLSDERKWSLTANLDWLAQAARVGEQPAVEVTLTYMGKEIPCTRECPYMPRTDLSSKLEILILGYFALVVVGAILLLAGCCIYRIVLKRGRETYVAS